jgi:CheY-like chemotaxis protein
MSYVLVVEDNPRTAKAISDMVELIGWEVYVAHSPRAAMQQMQLRMPALILLDFNIPGVDGLEVCRFIRRDPTVGEVPVVFISAESDPAIIAEAKKAGANDYLVKPVDIEVLEHILKDINPSHKP